MEKDAGQQWSLAARVGQLLQDERTARRLSQAVLAERAGTTQQQVSLVERGRAKPTTAMLDRLFAVLRLQVKVDPEPLGSDCDAEIGKYEKFSEADRVDWLTRYDRRLGQLDGMPFVLTGRLAAFILGAPVDARRLDLAVADSDLDRWSDWFHSLNCQRWNPRWADYGGLTLDPRVAGLPMRWMVGYDEVRLEVGAALPDAVTVTCGGLALRVRPLGDLERDYSDIRRIMRRVRDRADRRGPA